MPNYGDPKYWDDRYENAGASASFDWLESYASLKSLLDRFMPNKEIRILVLGCGNAEFSEDLYDDGYTNILNVDISQVVIQQMEERNAETRPLMEWKVVDITDMPQLADHSIDLAIDKSTIDALLCGDDSFLKVAMMMKETQRVLTIGGHYFAISYGKPESRSFHFTAPFLSFENREFILYESGCAEEEKEEKSHYIYVSKKLPDADQAAALTWIPCLEQMKIDAEQQRRIEAAEEAAIAEAAQVEAAYAEAGNEFDEEHVAERLGGNDGDQSENEVSSSEQAADNQEESKSDVEEPKAKLDQSEHRKPASTPSVIAATVVKEDTSHEAVTEKDQKVSGEPVAHAETNE